MSEPLDWMSDEEPSGVLGIQLKAIARDPRGLLRRRWMWMIPALALALAATALLFLYVIRPRYQATATILVSSQQIPEEYVRSTVSGLDSLANMNALMGEVLSNQNLKSLIAKYGLYPDQTEDKPLIEVVERMRTDISIEQQQSVVRRPRNETASIFVITYTYEGATESAAVTNEIANLFVNASIERRSRQARLTTEFLRRELEKAKAALDELNGRITDFRRTHHGVMPEDQEALLRKLERLEMQRQTLAAQIAETETRLSQLESEEDEQASPERMLTDLRLELASELAVHTEQHPNVIELRRRIERVEQQADEVAAIQAPRVQDQRDRTNATRAELVRLHKQLEGTESNTRKLDQRVAEIPKNEEIIEGLEERASVLKDSYLDFLRKVQEATLAETLETAQQGPKVSVLDHATPSQNPTRSPLLLLTAAIGVNLGLFVITGVAFELLDPVILNSDHLAFVGDAPFLGSVYES